MKIVQINNVNVKYIYYMQLDIEYFQKLFTISYIYITEILPKKSMC